MVMKKNKPAHIATTNSKLKPWYFLALALLSGTACTLALRQNNLNMIKLRDQVFVVDKANGDIEKALKDLREYVYAHMNTNLSSGNSIKPPIQLKYRYERLLEAEKQRVKTTNDKIRSASISG